MSTLHHGGKLDEAIAEFGGQREDWLDLSTGINPRSYPFPILAPTSFERLPEAHDVKQLDEAARQFYGVSPNQHVVQANGTQAIIQALPRLFSKDCSVDVVSPTYNEHGHCWAQRGAKVRAVSTLSDADANIVVVVNPNNPDGRRVEREHLLKVARDLKARGGTLIVDEAFGDCVPDFSIASAGLENVIALKSFGKFFGLAGVRLGFAICAENFAVRLQEDFGPWNVHGAALQIGTEAISNQAWIDDTRVWINEQSTLLQDCLTNSGFELVGNGALFVTVKHERSREIFTELCRNQILVRAFTANPDWLRFGLCKNGAQLNRLEAVFKGFEH